MTGKRSARPRGAVPFPTRDRVLEFIRESDAPVGKREIARAFRLTGPDRVRLRDLLREMKEKACCRRAGGAGRSVPCPRLP